MRLTDYYEEVAREATHNYQESDLLTDLLVHGPDERHRRRRVARALRGVTSLADVGCGFGYYLHDHLSSVDRVYLNDITPEMVRRLQADLAKRYPQLELHTTSCDLLDLPTEPERRYQLVMCLGVINHFNDDELPRVLERLSRLSEERVLLYYAHEAFILCGRVGRLLRGRGIHYQLHTRGAVAGHMKRHGLERHEASYAFIAPLLSPLVIEEYRRTPGTVAGVAEG